MKARADFAQVVATPLVRGENCYAGGAPKPLDSQSDRDNVGTVTGDRDLPRRGVEALTGTREVRHRVMDGDIQVGESARDNLEVLRLSGRECQKLSAMRRWSAEPG